MSNNLIIDFKDGEFNVHMRFGNGEYFVIEQRSDEYVWVNRYLRLEDALECFNFLVEQHTWQQEHTLFDHQREKH